MSAAEQAVTAEVTCERHGNVALVRFSNPPVNGLSARLRVQLGATLTEIVSDTAVEAVVLIGGGRFFSCGADIREFNTANATQEPTTRELIRMLEASRKPVVAAIHGAALGGGLELALGCHYRVAEAGAKLGLPEVKLGLLPGAGGTQRLPRLIGVEAALDMILSGEPVDADKARALGLVDAVYAGDLARHAVEFARSLAAQPPAAPRPKERAAAAGDVSAVFRAARERARKQARGLTAPLEIIACVEQSTQTDLEAGLRFERERFVRLVEGSESKALRHLFFAEREAVKPPAEDAAAPARAVGQVGVVGGGTMGRGIAMAFANAGLAVTLVEMNERALQQALGNIRDTYAAAAAKGRLSEAEKEQRLARIRGTLELEALAPVDLVIEAVFEDMAVKLPLFERLDRIVRPGAILATNTSRLDVNAIAGATSRPADVLGMHFFSPANVMRLLEVVRGARTAADVIVTAMQLARRIGKVPVLVGVCDGFVGNRMVSPYTREAHFLLEEGASPQQVDGALERFGMAMGPLRMGDLAGLDISWAWRKRTAATRPPHLRYCRVADRICEAGRFGQKTGAGFYRYEPGSRVPIPDPEIDRLIAECARESGIARRVVTDEEIVQRCIYALINEGAKVLQEGIARRASDIDVIYVNGYGFPAARGGPMFHADTVGLDQVLARIETFRQQHGELWEPAPLLQELVRTGRKLADYRPA